MNKEGLFDLLNSENQAALKAVFEQNPEVLQLYGNNLFLAILAVLDNEYNDTLLSYVVPLWQSVVEWELYQLGFKPRQEGVVSKYDFHSIYSHLTNRAKTLTTLNLPEIILSKQNAGQIIWTEREGIYSAWIIFQSEKGIVAGLIDNLNSQWLHPTWYRCITDLQVLKDTGIESLSSTERNTIVVTEFGEYKILWMQIDGEDGPVWRSLAMEYGASHEKGQSILWIRFIETYEVPTLCDQVLVPPVLSTDIGIYMDDFLKGTYSHEMVMVPVTCEVSINMKERVYELRFKDKSRETILDTLLFDSTAELVKTLRHPIRRGTPLRIKHGVRVMWDHRIDIDYHDTELKDGQKKHTISLSLLKPLVHRSRFFPDKFTVPKTCSELLSTEVGNPLTLRIQSEISAFRKMSVEFDGVPVGSSLRDLETMRMNIFDIALLSECEQLIDASTNKCHQIEIDANDLFDLNFSRLSENPRLQSAIASLDANDFDWTQHSWNINIDTRHPVQNEIIWYIKTKVSGRIWFNKIFTFVMDISLSIDEVISTFKEEVSLTVPLKHLTEFSESISTLNRTLRSRGWRKGKPRCRVDLTIRDGQYIAVVCRLEAHGESIEIANFPIDIAKDSSVLQDELESEWGPFSIYEIRNKNEFYKKVRSATLIEEEEEGFDEEEEYLRQIKEYESNPEKSYQLAYTYVKLVHCRPESDSSISDITKAIILFEECDHSVRGVVIWHLNALVTRCELLVKKGVDSIRKEEIKGWMREIQEMHDQLIQLSNIGE
ncbi:MAG: hypothetical protein E4H14_15460, partial [Candidatus Thorarchaeota archaeon]